MANNPEDLDSPESRDVIDQADALMRRHRSFIAQSAEPVVKAAEPPTEDLTDIPVLTEKVGAGETVALPAQLHAALAAELDRWLLTTLPVAVAQASEAMRADLLLKARQTLLPNLLETLKNGTCQKL